jgi:hypothetical protein
MKHRPSNALAGFLLPLCIGVPAASGQTGSFGGPPIHYATAEVNDRVAQLSAQVDSGQLELKYEDKHGYLASVLGALDIPVSSQALVFSKTSLQVRRISPRLPRAIYFNDDVYVGWCQRGEVLEIAATDAKQGATFYTLMQTADQPPEFVRDKGLCLSCHASSHTQNVPGYLIRSVFADFAGRPILGSKAFTTDHTSPLSQRWGGWYVTGKHGRMRHMGNLIFRENDGELDRQSGANLQSLDDVVSIDPYLSQHSDIVALMVLEHQTQMHNAIAAANYETRIALHQASEENELLDRDREHISRIAEQRIAASADRLLSYLLMCDEFPLEDAISGTSGFADDFQSRGLRDTKGRSLRDLDLQQRLFRYPCSYLIYSPAFDGLPREVRRGVLASLRDILEGRDDSPKYSHLSSQTRLEILEILRETKPEFGS